MEERLHVGVFRRDRSEAEPMELLVRDGKAEALTPCAPSVQEETLYLSDGFIDSHAHVYDGATDLGINADRIGYRTGVHLVVDAGSAGATNYRCFRDYVMPAYETPVKVFLNISRIGLVTKQPYYDRRTVDPVSAKRCLEEDGGEHILGIKVLASGLILEDAGLGPVKAAVEVGRDCGVPVMAHLAEGPPSNGEIMSLLAKGDLITHCFHGAPNITAYLRASRGADPDLSFCRLSNIMWDEQGKPVKPLEEALARGVYLDVGHGAASLDQEVARRVIKAGFRNFSISTDAHIRNLDHIVRSLPHTMSKFLAFGMSLAEVVASVTWIPARQLGLSDYCGHPLKRATIFTVRPVRADDPKFIDATGVAIDVRQVIEPRAIIRGGRFIWLDSFDSFP